MNYIEAYEKALRYGALSPMEHPEIGQLFHEAVGESSDAPDHTASIALADKMQELRDWRHHIFANPAPSEYPPIKWLSTVSHHLPKSSSTIGIYGPDVYLQTHMPNHNGSYGLSPHRAKLNREQYAALQTEAATDDVTFPNLPNE